MPTSDLFRVSDHDRAVFDRQGKALAGGENDDEGSAGWRDGLRRAESARRQAEGLRPLKEWWEDKTEMELHRRARALGLLG